MYLRAQAPAIGGNQLFSNVKIIATWYKSTFTPTFLSAARQLLALYICRIYRCSTFIIIGGNRKSSTRGYTMRDVMGFYHCDFMSKFKIIKLFSNKIFFTILNKIFSYKHLLTKVLKIFNYFSRSEFGSLENISDPDPAKFYGFFGSGYTTNFQPTFAIFLAKMM